VLWVLDQAAARRALSARRLRCPDCREPLRPWGRARSRKVHDTGATTQLTPDRARCTGCAATHVLLPATLVPRSGYGAGTVASALLAAAGGAGHRAIAADLALPAGTVRDWCRRARHGADAMFARRPDSPAHRGHGHPARRVDALGPRRRAEHGRCRGPGRLGAALRAAARPLAPPAPDTVDYLGALAAAHLHDLAHQLRLAPTGTATPLQLLTVVTSGLLPCPAR
jgi:uncharacterized protein DUF6431